MTNSQRGARSPADEHAHLPTEAGHDGAKTEMLLEEQQGVPQLEVPADVGPRGPAVVDDCPPDQTDLPPRRSGPNPEVGLLAVGEVPLVEQADVAQRFGPEGEEGAVGVVHRLPSVAPRRRDEAPAKELVDRGAELLARPVLGAGHRAAWALGQLGNDSPDATRLGAGVVWRDNGPRLSVGRLEPCPEADVRPGAEPDVGAGFHEFHPAIRPDFAAEPLELVRGGPAVDDHDAPHHLVVEEGPRCGCCRPGAVVVDDHHAHRRPEIHHGHRTAAGPAGRLPGACLSRRWRGWRRSVRRRRR